MPRFIFEIRKENGADYSEVSVYNIFCGIQRYIRQNGNPELDFFADSSFASVRNALDSKLKLLRKSGGGIANPSEIISIEEEELLWSKGLLGEHSPDVLRDTIVFMCGLYFALRGGAELRSLKRKQICLKTGSTGGNYLLYEEMGSKNNPGGLNTRRVAIKQVPHFQNKSNPGRDFVRLYSKYLSKCPPSEHVFLQSLKKPSADRWYTSRPVGHNPLGGTVKRICALAGIVGKKTNHSLRATAATRLFQAGSIDEQLIMKMTGHRSMDGVRAYKRVSNEQFKEMSDILQNSDADHEKENKSPIFQNNKICGSSLKQESVGDLPHLSLNNCSNVTINFSK